MPTFFPRNTVEWHMHEPPAIRRLSLSLVAMAVLAGILIRLYRLAFYTWARPTNILTYAALWTGGLLIMLGLATLYLGNYPVRHWLWRAPVFGLCEATTALLTGAALIAIGIERTGTGVMGWGEWRARFLWTIVWHTLIISAFALVLGIVVQTVRHLLLRREHREHTLDAIHEDHVRTQEHHTPKS
jgi:hypothetical protein